MGCFGEPLTKGAFRYIFLMALAFTWILWNVAVLHCTFINIGNKTTKWVDRDEYGLFGYPLHDNERIYTCVSFSPNTVSSLEAGEIAGRIFAAFGFSFHSLALILVVISETCLRGYAVKRMWLLARIFLIASWICSILIFSVYARKECMDPSYSSTICTPGPGGIMALFNIVVLIPTILLSWLTGPPGNPCLLVRRFQEGDMQTPTASTPEIAPASAPVTEAVNKEDSSSSPAGGSDESNSNHPVVNKTLEMDC